jgi:hypothetical protein
MLSRWRYYLLAPPGTKLPSERGFSFVTGRNVVPPLDVALVLPLAAMEKGVPLPELPIDPPLAPRDPRVPLIVSIVLATFGGGTRMASVIMAAGKNHWAAPLPVTLVGIGLMLY